MNRITSTNIKWIAFTTMFIDHFAAIVIKKMILANGPMIDINDISTMGSWNFLGWVYFISRVIGRIAFPLYLFLMVQGVIYSRKIWAYFLNILIFALISEIPYDLAFSTGGAFTILNWDHQNIFLELTLALSTMISIKFLEKNIEIKLYRIILSIISILIFALASLYVKAGYTAAGILAAGFMYMLRTNPVFAYICGCAILLLENGYIGFAALTMIPIIRNYNGKKGKTFNKYLFYSLYPVHLLVLGLWGHVL